MMPRATNTSFPITMYSIVYHLLVFEVVPRQGVSGEIRQDLSPAHLFTFQLLGGLEGVLHHFGLN
jgi:hypothetical protein